MGLLALVVVILVGDRLTGGRLSGGGQHAVDEKATTLEIPGVGSVPLFLNPSDRAWRGSARMRPRS